MARADIFKEQNIMKKYNKKMTAVMTTILAAMLLAGCGSETKNAVDTGSAVELTILAAASLTDVCNEIKTEYEAAHPNMTLNFSYGASGALQTQIEEGAPADLFFSAATKQMTALNDEGLMDPDSIVKLLENKVVLIVPEDSDKDITSFEDVATDKVGMIGLGEPGSVPVGDFHLSGNSGYGKDKGKLRLRCPHGTLLGRNRCCGLWRGICNRCLCGREHPDRLRGSRRFL